MLITLVGRFYIYFLLLFGEKYIKILLPIYLFIPNRVKVYVVPSISFQTCFVQASKIVEDLKIQYVIAIHRMR